LKNFIIVPVLLVSIAVARPHQFAVDARVDADALARFHNLRSMVDGQEWMFFRPVISSDARGLFWLTWQVRV
jgi:hypothetical protein